MLAGSTETTMLVQDKSYLLEYIYNTDVTDHMSKGYSLFLPAERRQHIPIFANEGNKLF